MKFEFKSGKTHIRKKCCSNRILPNNFSNPLPPLPQANGPFGATIFAEY